MATCPQNDYHQILYSEYFTPALPMWRRVVFVDWNGVLSSDLFWHSILNQEQHPIKKRLQTAKSQLFSNKERLDAWMLGRLAATQIVSDFDIELPLGYRSTYLLDRLMEDCRKMTIDLDLIDGLRAFRNNNFLVLATDNADCFAKQVSRRLDITSLFDAVLCSSELHCYKSDVLGFFGPWLQLHQVSIRDAILIDDGESNCDAFTKLGGNSIHHISTESTLHQLQLWETNSPSSLALN